VAAGGGRNILFFARPTLITGAAIEFGANLNFNIVPTPALAVGTIVGIEAAAFVSAFDSTPRFEVSNDALLHFDTAAAAIAVEGTPNTVAAPSEAYGRWTRRP